MVPHGMAEHELEVPQSPHGQIEVHGLNREGSPGRQLPWHPAAGSTTQRRQHHEADDRHLVGGEQGDLQRGGERTRNEVILR